MGACVYRMPAEPLCTRPPRQSVREFVLVLLVGAAAVYAVHTAFRLGTPREGHHAASAVATSAHAPVGR